MKTQEGPVALDALRDRNSRFESSLVNKQQTVLSGLYINEFPLPQHKPYCRSILSGKLLTEIGINIESIELAW